jgi:hypothetical protein
MLEQRRRKEGATSEASDSHTEQPKPHWRKIFSGLRPSSKSTPGKELPANHTSSETYEDEEVVGCQATPCEDVQTAQPRDAEPPPKKEMPKMRPIVELWDEAYQDLALQNKTLIDKYERELAIGTDFPALALKQKRAKMKTILEEKIKAIEDGAWRVKFKEHEFAIKGAVERVVGVIEVRLRNLMITLRAMMLYVLVSSLSLVPVILYSS